MSIAGTERIISAKEFWLCEMFHRYRVAAVYHCMALEQVRYRVAAVYHCMAVEQVRYRVANLGAQCEGRMALDVGAPCEGRMALDLGAPCEGRMALDLGAINSMSKQQASGLTFPPNTLGHQ